MDATYGITAPHYTKFGEDADKTITVLPPYEPKSLGGGAVVPQWVRGNIRLASTIHLGPRDFVVTAPPMSVVYNGCRWNRLVFSLPGEANPEVYAFENWLRHIMEVVKTQIWANPSRFKPGSMTNQRFTFDEGCIKPSSDSSIYPDELQTRLSMRRLIDSNGDVNEPQEIVDTEFLLQGDSGVEYVSSTDITMGSIIQPIIKISYNRIGERFGLVLTVLKAKVISLNNTGSNKIQNSSWIFDEAMEI